MPRSYSQNTGFILPADGEEDGVWGDVVNDNMGILDRAINGHVTLSLSGTSSNLTTSDGTLSDGQYGLLVLGGSLSATHTITILPNDAQKIYLVRNTTSQSVVFTQGSGGNATIVAGGSGIIYSNGGGASAAVVNLTSYLAMSSVKITGGSITGATISGITDLAVADGGTGASTASDARTNLGAQATITGAATTITSSNLTASRAVVSDGSGKISVSSATSTEVGYLSGVTSSIQTQLGTKAPSASPTLSGTITISGGTQNWTVVASGTDLVFSYNGAAKMKLSSDGSLTVTGDITAYGSI